MHVTFERWKCREKYSALSYFDQLKYTISSYAWS